MTVGRDETIGALALALARGRVSSEQLVARCLERIARLNPRLNAFTHVDGERALGAARAADRARADGRARTALHGIPVSLKDLIDEAGQPNTAGSRVRRDVIATSDATVTTRLGQAGAILLGRTNLHEFAFGTTSTDSAFGPARHPLDDTRVPGGSSGGSAIAVATGMSVASIGTDTGGSVRIPAAVCGVVGLKPTWGEIPTDGIVPLSRQLDHVGPLTRSVEDAWLVHETLAGRAPAMDAGLEPRPLAGVRLGQLGGVFAERIDPDVDDVFEHALDRLRRAGARISPVALPWAGDIAPVYLALVLADAAAHHGPALDQQPDDYTPNVRLRLELGRYVLAEDYVRALRGREVFARACARTMQDVDALVCPTLPVTAPLVGAESVDVGTAREPVRSAMLRFTQPFNLSRQPALTVPCGVTRSLGLPAGLQLAGRLGGTTALLQVGLAVERALAD